MKNWTKSRIKGVFGKRFFPRFVLTVFVSSSGLNKRSFKNSPAA